MRPKPGLAPLLFCGALVALGSACAAVPDVRFADGDGSGPDAGTEATDSGDAGAPDTAVNPADATVLDAAPPNGCPATPPPPGVDMCCGATSCIDRSTSNSCASCDACVQQRCQVGEVCCYPKNGNLSCKKSAADCK
jgi:hypothetical protein